MKKLVVEVSSIVWCEDTFEGTDDEFDSLPDELTLEFEEEDDFDSKDTDAITDMVFDTLMEDYGAHVEDFTCHLKSCRKVK